jgi:hypothetical protein
MSDSSIPVKPILTPEEYQYHVDEVREFMKERPIEYQYSKLSDPTEKEEFKNNYPSVHFQNNYDEYTKWFHKFVE